jgi:sulfatase maturation enzyme AslB (radical SAM superfamily)
METLFFLLKFLDWRKLDCLYCVYKERENEGRKKMIRTKVSTFGAGIFQKSLNKDS